VYDFRGGGLWCQTADIPVWQRWLLVFCGVTEIIHPTFYTVYIFYFRIVFNSTATVVILEADFIDIHEISLTKNIVYCIVCFKNERIYNLMMADIAAET
jgi:hypothetical protein